MGYQKSLIPLSSLLRRRLGIAFALLVLRRGRGSDQRRIHDRAAAQQFALRGQVLGRANRPPTAAVEGAIPKRSPAARQVAPRATASIRRSRRSLESGLIMRAGLLQPEAECLCLAVIDFFANKIVEQTVEFNRRRFAVPRSPKPGFQSRGIRGRNDDLTAGGRCWRRDESVEAEDGSADQDKMEQWFAPQSRQGPRTCLRASFGSCSRH